MRPFFRLISVSLLFTAASTSIASDNPDRSKYFVDRESSRLVLHGPCERIEQNISALRAWTQKTKETAGPTPQVQKSADGTCSADISESLPMLVRKYHNGNPERDGPNCWNTALVLSGLAYGLRYTSTTEIYDAINSPLCREIKSRTDLVPGDIGILRMQTPKRNAEKEMHGFIYISKDLVYSKNGYKKTQPYALQPYSNMEEEYGEYNHKDESSCPETMGGLPTRCLSSLTFYRCSPLKDWIQENRSDLQKDTLDALDTTNWVECEMSKDAIAAQPYTAREIKLIRDTHEILFEKIRKDWKEIVKQREHDKSPALEKNIILIGNLWERLAAIEEQLNYNRAGATVQFLPFKKDELNGVTVLRLPWGAEYRIPTKVNSASGADND